MKADFKYRQVIGSISSRSGSVLFITPESICENRGSFADIEDQCVREGNRQGAGGELVLNELEQFVAVAALLKHANCSFPVVLEGNHADDIQRLVIDFRMPEAALFEGIDRSEETSQPASGGGAGAAPNGAIAKNLLDGKGFRTVGSIDEVIGGGQDVVMTASGREPEIGAVVIEGTTLLIFDPRVTSELEEVEDLVDRCEAVSIGPMRGGPLSASLRSGTALVANVTGGQGCCDVRYLRDERGEAWALVVDLGHIYDDGVRLQREFASE